MAHSVNVIGSLLNTPQSLNWYACTQRFIRRRYTRTPHAASATRGLSRQTDFKGLPLQRIVRFCHVFSRLSVTDRQRFKYSGIADVLQSLGQGHLSATIAHSCGLA